MKIPQSKIDEIKQATDIIELISQYVSLKLRGRNYVGLCPFHNEKTPSFTVSPDKQIFYCFGCGTGGDVFSFIKTYEKINYPEAIRFLAEKKNIELPQYTSPEEANENSEIEELYFIHKIAARFFYDQWKTPPSQYARDYLKKRGFDEKMITAFGIGYAPDAWDALMNHCQSQSIDIKLLERAGLAIPKSGGGHYDRFRHRLMFPVFNVSGRVIAFGGRQLREENNSPKYVNSPESPIYQKGKVLYGLSQAKDAIRKLDEIIIVEGYADCISLHQFGITNVAASSGTAFTTDQANLIRRYTQNVALIYDGDEAGLRAAERGGALMLEAGLNIKIIVLPKEHDPDSFVRAQGSDAFQDTIRKGKAYLDFRISNWQLHKKLDTVNDRTAAAREILAIVARIRDPIKQNFFVKELSDKIGLDENVVATELKKLSGKTFQEARSLPVAAPDKHEKANIPEHILRAERSLLKSLLTGEPEQAQHIFNHVRPEEFQNPAIHKVAEAVYHQFMLEESFDFEAVSKLFEGDIQKALSRLMIEQMDTFDIDDCLAAIQVFQLEKKTDALRSTMKIMEQEKEDISNLYDAWLIVFHQIQNIKTKKQLLSVEGKPMQERIF